MDDPAQNRASLIASIALLCFSALTALALVNWVHLSPTPWIWQSVLSAGCAVLGVIVSWLVWQKPTRQHVLMGGAVMIASLLRIGAPAHWSWVSFALVAATFVLLMPLVYAATVLTDEE